MKRALVGRKEGDVKRTTAFCEKGRVERALVVKRADFEGTL